MKRVWPLVLLLGLILAVLWRPRPEAPQPRLPRTTASSADPADGLDFHAELPTPPPAEPAPAPESAPAPAPVPPEDEDEMGSAMTSLKWLLHHQNADGSWGDGPMSFEGHVIDKPAITGLALLAFMGAGYSHLSKDTYGGKSMGAAVRAGMKWLIQDQRDDGAFLSARDASLDQAIGSLALTEAYGLTGSNLFKEPSQRAVDALSDLQGRDGGWGTGVQTAWATFTLWSASISEIPVLVETTDALRRRHDARADADASTVLFRMGIDKDKGHPALGPAIDRIAARPPSPQSPDFHAWYLDSMMLFQYDGPAGPKWKAWNEPFKDALLQTQSRTGQWQGGTRSHTVVQTSLASLCLEIYFRYSSVTHGR